MRWEQLHKQVSGGVRVWRSPCTAVWDSEVADNFIRINTGKNLQVKSNLNLVENLRRILSRGVSSVHIHFPLLLPPLHAHVLYKYLQLSQEPS